MILCVLNSQVRGRTPRSSQGSGVKRLSPIKSACKGSAGMQAPKGIRFGPGTKLHDGRGGLGSAGKHPQLRKTQCMNITCVSFIL